MNEKMQEIGKKLLERFDLVISISLLVIMSGTIYLVLLQEQSAYLDPEPPAQPRDWNVQVSSEDEKYVAIQAKFLSSVTDVTQDEEARRIIQNNMFDLRAVREQEEVRREINQRYNEADAAWTSGNFDTALRIVNEILATDPTHQASLELRRRIQETLEE